MMWGYGDGAWWWMWVPAVLVPVLIIAGIVVLIVLLVRSTGSSGRTGGTPSEPDPARRILEERLARGEITTEEFRQSLSALDESRRQAT